MFLFTKLAFFFISLLFVSVPVSCLTNIFKSKSSQESLKKLHNLLGINDLYDFEKRIDDELETLKEFLLKDDVCSEDIEHALSDLYLCIDRAKHRPPQLVSSDSFDKAQSSLGAAVLGLIFVSCSFKNFFNAIKGENNSIISFADYDFSYTHKLSGVERFFEGYIGALLLGVSSVFFYLSGKFLKRYMFFSDHLKYRREFINVLIQKINVLRQELIP